LGVILESSVALKMVNLSNCSLQAQTMNFVVSGLGSNPNISDVTLNLSGNELGPIGAGQLADILAENKNLGTLLVQNCGFKKEGLGKILEKLSMNTTLRGLDISLNLHTGSAIKMKRVVEKLAEVVARHPTLRHLSLRGDGSKFSIGNEIRPLIDCLAQNPALTELDIAGNKIGDQHAVDLCNALRSNTRLVSLLWDQNNIGIGGWQAMVNLLGNNQTIRHCPRPQTDMEKALREAKVRDTFETRMRECMDNMQMGLKRNAGTSTEYVSEYEKAKKGRTYTVRPAFETLRPGSMKIPAPLPVQEYSIMPQETYTPPPPAFTPPAYQTNKYNPPNQYNPPSYGQSYDNQGYDNQGYDNQGYDNQGYDQGYDNSYTQPPEPTGYEVASSEAYTGQEYDDTNYGGGDMPPPPPPLPY